MNIVDKRILHVGCGGNPLPDWLKGVEVRLDINADHNPDIVASMTDLGDIGRFDVVYCSHALEHLFWHDALTALEEFKRVLHPNGFALIIVPDLEDIKPTNEVVFNSLGGDITGLDMYYGFSKMVVTNPEMGHKYGYTASSLRDAMEVVGFSNVTTKRLPEFNLMGVGQP